MIRKRRTTLMDRPSRQPVRSHEISSEGIGILPLKVELLDKRHILNQHPLQAGLPALRFGAANVLSTKTERGKPRASHWIKDRGDQLTKTIPKIPDADGETFLE